MMKLFDSLSVTYRRPLFVSKHVRVDTPARLPLQISELN